MYAAAAGLAEDGLLPTPAPPPPTAVGLLFAKLTRMLRSPTSRPSIASAVFAALRSCEQYGLIREAVACLAAPGMQAVQQAPRVRP